MQPRRRASRTSKHNHAFKVTSGRPYSPSGPSTPYPEARPLGETSSGHLPCHTSYAAASAIVRPPNDLAYRARDTARDFATPPSELRSARGSFTELARAAPGAARRQCPPTWRPSSQPSASNPDTAPALNPSGPHDGSSASRVTRTQGRERGTRAKTDQRTQGATAVHPA